jgi:inner membrane protein
MASLPSHAIAALGLGAFFYKPGIPKRVWVVGAICSVIPDIDVIGFRFGIRYGDFWGHRGFTHSLIFAAALASAVVFLGFRGGLPNISPLSMWTYFFLATASHGLLDAMTDGGLGVAFFSPFDNHRYFLPWTPIRVSPIGLGRFLTSRGSAVIRSELLWIWVPAGVLVASAWLLRSRRPASNAKLNEP